MAEINAHSLLMHQAHLPPVMNGSHLIKGLDLGLHVQSLNSLSHVNSVMNRNNSSRSNGNDFPPIGMRMHLNGPSFDYNTYKNNMNMRPTFDYNTYINMPPHICASPTTAMFQTLKPWQGMSSVAATPLYNSMNVLDAHPSRVNPFCKPDLREHNKERNEAMSSVASPNKKRKKVTDFGITQPQRTVSRISGQNAIRLPAGYNNNNTNNIWRPYDIPASTHAVNADGSSANTLGEFKPAHLRKAKLMFYWVRHPTALLVVQYFPDVQFTKKLTRTLMKWFSNFREFFYKEIENYVEGKIAAGAKIANHLEVRSELLQALHKHFDRNTHIEIPQNFRLVVEQTARRFFIAIQAGEKAGPATRKIRKRPIYDAISKMDEIVPDYFKTVEFSEQLE